MARLYTQKQLDDAVAEALKDKDEELRIMDQELTNMDEQYKNMTFLQGINKLPLVIMLRFGFEVVVSSSALYLLLFDGLSSRSKKSTVNKVLHVKKQ